MTSNNEIFSFPNWYPIFENDSGEAIVLPVPNDVLEYLRGDGPLMIPLEANSKPNVCKSCMEQNCSSEWCVGDDCLEMEPPSFPMFSKKLEDAINVVGGVAFIKSNWHAAKDASWIIPGCTLKCSNIEDAYLLLKGSDIICSDFNYEFQSDRCEKKHCIVVKRWLDVHPSGEFRCFVSNHTIFAISQRDLSSYYSYIEVSKYHIIKDIVNFFQQKIKGLFPCSSYVFDVARLDSGPLQIIDFQPLDKDYTDGILFSWEELSDLADSLCEAVNSSESPEFRFIGEDPGVQLKRCKLSGVPFEVEELCSNIRNVSLLDYVSEEVRKQDLEDH